MRGFVGQNRVILWGFWELIEPRHVDGFGRIGTIERAVSAVPDLDTYASEKRFRARDSLVVAQFRLEPLGQSRRKAFS